VAAFLSPPEQLNLGRLYASLRHVKTRMQNPAPPGPADSTPGTVSESASPTRSEVDKSRSFVSASCLVADVTALASSLVPPFVCWLTRSSDRLRRRVTAGPTGTPEPLFSGAERRKRSEARTAVGRKRAPSHGGPTRPAIDRREIVASGPARPVPAPPRGRSRCGLHLTFVGTTQERPTPRRTGRTAPAGCSQ